MKYVLISVLALLLSACSCDPKVVYKEVKVPVVEPCVQTMPEKPVYPLQESDVGDSVFTLAKKALAEIELRKGYELELEAVLVACKK